MKLEPDICPEGNPGFPSTFPPKLYKLQFHAPKGLFNIDMSKGMVSSLITY